MSISTTAQAAGTAGDADRSAGGAGRWLIVAVLVVIAGALSGFYGINEYASGTGVQIEEARANSERFATIYQDSAEKRLATLRFGLDILLNNKVITDAFTRDDRATLQAKVEPFFKDVLHKRYEIDQLNFFTPPAIVYLRADNPKVFGNDLSAVRKTIVVAGERRQMVSGMETGLGGIVALRAVAPVLDGARLVGTIGVGDAISHFLDHAAATSGMDYALGLNRAVAEKAERPVDPKNDAVLGTDVFFVYSSPDTGRIIRNASFDPRVTTPVLVPVGDRTVFIKTFVLNNFAGVPTVVVATVRDMTEAFAEVRQAVVIKAAILFLLVSVVGSVAMLQFRAIRAGLQGAMFSQRRELEEKTAALKAAKAKLVDADQIKRGFFTNLVLSLNEPLHGVVGQLQSVIVPVDAVLRGANAPDTAGRERIIERLRFALAETSRFSRLVDDFRQLETFRNGLAGGGEPVALAAVVADALEHELLPARRLPHLTIRASVGNDLPPVRGDAQVLRKAVAGLADYAVQGAGRGTVDIKATLDADGMVAVSITGTAFQIAGAPDTALLDETRQFLTRLTAPPAVFESGGGIVGVLQAQAAIRSFGGTLAAADPKAGQPGFLLRLPAAS
jgi:hypothetical protein